MKKIHIHTYEFIVLKDKKPDYRFRICIPYEGNEKAVDAVKTATKFANHHLTDTGRLLLEYSDYAMEYISPFPSDDMISSSIEKNGYAVIPYEIEPDPR